MTPPDEAGTHLGLVAPEALTGLLARCPGMRSLTVVQARWHSSKNRATSMSLVRAVDKASNATGSQTISLHGKGSLDDSCLIQQDGDERLAWSAWVWSLPPKSNRRPHPYPGSAAKRRAKARLRRSLRIVGGQVMCSLRRFLRAGLRFDPTASQGCCSGTAGRGPSSVTPV